MFKCLEKRRSYVQFVHCSVIQEQNWNYILVIFFVFSVSVSIWVGIYRYLYTAECRGHVQRWQHQVWRGISPRARYSFIPNKSFKMHILVFSFSGYDCPDCDTINFVGSKRNIKGIYCLCSPSDPSWPVLGWTVPLPLPLYCPHLHSLVSHLRMFLQSQRWRQRVQVKHWYPLYINYQLDALIIIYS